MIQDKCDEREFSECCDQLTHSKAVARMFYKNLTAVRSSAQSIEKIYATLANAATVLELDDEHEDIMPTTAKRAHTTSDDSEPATKKQKLELVNLTTENQSHHRTRSSDDNSGGSSDQGSSGENARNGCYFNESQRNLLISKFKNEIESQISESKIACPMSIVTSKLGEEDYHSLKNDDIKLPDLKTKIVFCVAK